MATWIVHLRIAEALLERLPGLDAAAFVVGNIAPDSGMPDEKWEKFTPPPEVTHFKSADDTAYDLADLVFQREHLADLHWPGTEAARYSFLLGYFCHLVTDNLWYLWIGEPTQRRFKAEFEVDKDFIWEVKKDWYGLDFEFVRSHPDSIYWRVFMDCDYPVNYLDFLLPEGVRQRIEHIKAYYQKDDDHAREVINRERIYLTQTQMDQFVAGAVALLDYWYSNQEQLKPPKSASSILEIINAQKFCELTD